MPLAVTPISAGYTGLLVITDANPLVEHLLGLFGPLGFVLVPGQLLHLPGLIFNLLDLLLLNQINRAG